MGIGSSKNRKTKTYFKTEVKPSHNFINYNSDPDTFSMDQRFQKQSSSAMSLGKYLKN